MQVTGQTAATFGYDDARRITGITQGTNVVGFTYDADSRRTQATLPNGVTIDYAYDNANQWSRHAVRDIQFGIAWPQGDRFWMNPCP